jgi:DNA polymerase I
MPNTIYLIDGSAYIHRAFHAIRGLASSSGLPTNAVYGFTRMLLKLLEDKTPEYVAVLFDAKGPTFRHERYAEYKANRPPMPEDLAVQIPYIHQVTEGFRIPMLRMPGYEADDLIGTLARQAQKAGFSVVMVTGDKDFIQLVTDQASIWDPMKDKTTTAAEVAETFGVTPARMVDVMGLSGDTSDNIPGVPGIGQKTALTLIREYGTLEALYEEIETLKRKKQRENLITHRDQAFLSRDLAAIQTEVPIPDGFAPEQLKRVDPDTETLGRLFRFLEFRELQQTYSEGAAAAPEKTYEAVTDPDALEALARRLAAADVIAIDTETTSEHPLWARLVGVSVSMSPHEAFYIPCGHDYIGAPDQIPCDTVLAALAPVLSAPTPKKVGQNIKYDWTVLSRHGVELAGVGFDTMVASYLINPAKRAHNLDQIALDFLDHKTIPYESVAGKGKSAVPFSQVAVEAATDYAAEDADVTFRAYEVLRDRLDEIGLTELMETVEMPLVPVLMRMENRGIRVDRDRLRTLSGVFSDEMDQLEARIHEMAGESFNIKSSQQLGRILFEKLGLPTRKKTKKKTGYSTDVEVLTFLAGVHDLPALVLRHRTLAKLKSTYTDALVGLIHPETGRIHSSFNQTVTATGRLSSSEPNLQNIPVRDAEGRQIRSAFIPREGWQLVSADYSQIELRILAHVSEDPILIESFERGEDIHTRTAEEVFGATPDGITPALRRQAKAINFGIIYGMSAYGLSRDLGISRRMAKTYIDQYFKRYAGVKQYLDQTVAAARESRQTATLLGRIRLLPDIDSPNANVRGFAERMAVNTPIQGTAADLIKLAMIRVDRAIAEAGLESAMLLTVHDELIFEAPPEEIAPLTELVKGIMEGVWSLRVRLKVNVDSGDNWAEAH